MNQGHFQRACLLVLSLGMAVNAAPLTNGLAVVRVAGGDFGGRNSVAAWCRLEVEPILARLAAEWPRGAPLLVVRLYGAANGSPRIERSAAPSAGGGGIGTVAVTGWVNANGEELLEACVGAALDAGLGGSVPAWFAVGLAQGGHPGCRARNRLLRRSVPDDAAPALETLLAWQRLPGDTAMQRAWCGEVALFLTDHGKPATRALLQRLAGGAPVTPSVLASDLQVGVSEFERQWQRWLAQREQVFQEMGGLTPDALDGLRARLPAGSPPVPPRNFLLPGADTAPARRAAAWQAFSLRRFKAVQDPALAAVAEAYAFYYEGVAKGRWHWRLRRRLEKAENALAALERLTVERTGWLDAIERESGAGGAGEAPAELVVEKSRLREYIDRIERETTASAISVPGAP